MRPIRFPLLFRLLIAATLFVGRYANAQGCDPSQSEFPAPRSAIDTIEIASYGGFPVGGTVVSVDVSGSVAVLVWPPCSQQIKHARVDPSVFAEFLAQASRAVEIVRNQPDRPNPSTGDELLEIIRTGRIEGVCLSAVDGVDVDVTLLVNGVNSKYPCVTGELLKFGQAVLRFALDAVEDSR